MRLTDYLGLASREVGLPCAPFGSGSTLDTAKTVLEQQRASDEPRLVDGSLASLAGLQPGATVLLDLSGRRMLGRALQPEITPPLCTVGGRVGALWVDTRGLKGKALERWRELDRLEEEADWSADFPKGNPWALTPAQRAEGEREKRREAAELEQRRAKKRAEYHARQAKLAAQAAGRAS